MTGWRNSFRGARALLSRSSMRRPRAASPGREEREEGVTEAREQPWHARQKSETTGEHRIFTSAGEGEEKGRSPQGQQKRSPHLHVHPSESTKSAGAGERGTREESFLRHLPHKSLGLPLLAGGDS